MGRRWLDRKSIQSFYTPSQSRRRLSDTQESVKRREEPGIKVYKIFLSERLWIPRRSSGTTIGFGFQTTVRPSSLSRT